MTWMLLIAALLRARARSAPWVRKNGNPSMREILVKASGMARGRVRLRPIAYSLRCTSPQMTFLHKVIFAQRALAAIRWRETESKPISLVKGARTGFLAARARLAFVMRNCTSQMIFLWKWSTRNLPDLKTVRKIAKTGSKACRKYSPLSQMFVRWPALMFFLSTALGMPF